MHDSRLLDRIKMQTKAAVNKEWASHGRDGAGLREEQGEDWCVAILQDGTTDAAATDRSYTILRGEVPLRFPCDACEII
jgi:hypothetical protein